MNRFFALKPAKVMHYELNVESDSYSLLLILKNSILIQLLNVQYQILSQ